MQIKYTFDDVLLLPEYSDVLPSETNLSNDIWTSGERKFVNMGIPVFSAAMNTITEVAMCTSMRSLGGFGVLHKYLGDREESTIDLLNELCTSYVLSVGPNDLNRLEKYIGKHDRIKAISIDSAHGHTKNIIEFIKEVRKKYPTLYIIAGNITTAHAALALLDAGADALKLGIGSGAVCTTRIVTGVGCPLFSAIQDVYELLYKRGFEKTHPIIADGGIRNSADIAKAIGAGASAVMLGSILSGTEETPGSLIEKEVDGHTKYYKKYSGMGSPENMKIGGAERYNQKSVRSVSEGIDHEVAYKGSAINIVEELMGALRSSMGYCGFKDLKDFVGSGKFCTITQNGIKESNPHILNK